MENHTEANAILLPGRIPGYKRDDLKLLPSDTSKKVSVLTWTFTNYIIVLLYLKDIWKTYKTCCEQTNFRGFCVHHLLFPQETAPTTRHHKATYRSLVATSTKHHSHHERSKKIFWRKISCNAHQMLINFTNQFLVNQGSRQTHGACQLTIGNVVNLVPATSQLQSVIFHNLVATTIYTTIDYSFDMAQQVSKLWCMHVLALCFYQGSLSPWPRTNM